MFVSIFRLVSSYCTCGPSYIDPSPTLLWSSCPFFRPSLTFLHRLTSLTSGTPIAISLPASWMFVGWLYPVCCSYSSNHRHALPQRNTSMLLEKRVSRFFRPSRRIGTESAQLDSLVSIHSNFHGTKMHICYLSCTVDEFILHNIMYGLMPFKALRVASGICCRWPALERSFWGQRWMDIQFGRAIRFDELSLSYQ